MVGGGEMLYDIVIWVFFMIFGFNDEKFVVLIVVVFVGENFFLVIIVFNKLEVSDLEVG